MRNQMRVLLKTAQRRSLKRKFLAFSYLRVYCRAGENEFTCTSFLGNKKQFFLTNEFNLL